jgi:hypothetical protein
MIFPEEGTKADFKHPVLHNIIRNTCEDCHGMFIPIMDMFFDHKCPACARRYILVPYFPVILNSPSLAMMGVMATA